jgi:CO/xanthine dehydrogenase FAD-binding subunit
MTLWKTYLRPQTLSAARQALRSAPQPALPIAGGTDLLLDLRQGRHAPVQTLVDLTAVAEMTVIEQRSQHLFIGAAVPVSRIHSDPLVARHAQALTEASALIAGPQVRNVATLGGNVAHALPAADGTIALLALDSQVEITAISGESRLVQLSQLFLGPGKSAIKQGEELIVGFDIPINTEKPEALQTSSCFKRIMRPQGVALPILNCAIWLAREGDCIYDIRIAVGPGGPIPFRVTEAEATLRGQALTDKAIERALEALLDQAQFRTSPRRASADYRRHLVGGLFKDVLQTAWSRAT